MGRRDNRDKLSDPELLTPSRIKWSGRGDSLRCSLASVQQPNSHKEFGLECWLSAFFLQFNCIVSGTLTHGNFEWCNKQCVILKYTRTALLECTTKLNYKLAAYSFITWLSISELILNTECLCHKVINLNNYFIHNI